MAGFLVDKELHKFAEKYIQPYDPALINPASIDLRLGHEFMHPLTQRTETIPDGGVYNLLGWHDVLAITYEHIIMPVRYVADLKLKTTPARRSINHTLAGWVDPGYKGKLTLTLFAVRSAVLVPKMRICQLVIYELDKVPERSYATVGHYMNQQHPTPAVSEENDDT